MSMEGPMGGFGKREWKEEIKMENRRVVIKI